MASETATIRVTRETRDLLAQHASERGLSLAAFLAEVADERRRQAVWQSERDASRTDAQDANAQAEVRAWEVTLEDGLG